MINFITGMIVGLIIMFVIMNMIHFVVRHQLSKGEKIITLADKIEKQRKEIFEKINNVKVPSE